MTVSIGHCHPKVVAAAQKQTETLMHSTTIYYNPEVAMFAKELAAKMPGDLKSVYFTNSGSEANDLAMLMARCYTGNYDFLALRYDFSFWWLLPIIGFSRAGCVCVEFKPSAKYYVMW